jgi:hypothetical protein
MRAAFDKIPTMLKGKVHNVTIEYWSYFKVMVEGGSVVDGLVCYIPSKDAVNRMREFETEAYDDG